MGKRIRMPLFIVMLAVMIAAAGCSGGNKETQSATETLTPKAETYFIFDTIVTLRVYDDKMTKTHFDEVKALLQEIDGQMNRQQENSEIGQVNKNAGVAPVKVSPQTMKVVKRALYYASISDAMFDPSIGPIVDLWGVGSDRAAVPTQEAINERKALVNYKDITIDEANSTIMLEKPGMIIDLGAIAKGYAADVMAAYLKEKGFKSAIIDLGGNVLAMGAKPGGGDWRIGIQTPEEARGNHLGVLPVKDKTIVTSGVYERYFEENGKMYHHLMDGRTGYPVDKDLLSVTVITDVSMNADAMSTAAFAYGVEKGMQFIEEQENSEAIFVTTERNVYLTSGLKGIFQLTNDEFHLAN
jgi:FAD:protein FMN transferase